MEKYQKYKEYVKEHFTAYRQKGLYSPLYFVPQKWIKDKIIFVVGDSVSNENDYKREVTTKPYSEIFNEINSMREDIAKHREATYRFMGKSQRKEE